MDRYQGIRVRRNWTLAQRMEFYSRPDPSGCTIWGGPRETKGYGNIFWQGKNHKAHRMAWVVVNGPIPVGMCICHKCDVPACVNPDHLFLGTDADNTADRVAKGRQSRGERHRAASARALLTMAQVAEIIAIPKGTRGATESYGVSKTVIYRARKRWRDV